jgi:hypothetical protein
MEHEEILIIKIEEFPGSDSFSHRPILASSFPRILPMRKRPSQPREEATKATMADEFQQRRRPDPRNRDVLLPRAH